MAFVHIKNLLQKVIGLHVDTVGESSIDRAISHRMHVTACGNVSEYYKIVKKNNLELDELIEEIVVPETWFFRNVTPFEMLRDNALKIYENITNTDKLKKHNNEVSGSLKILSIPCSSGEEPYSIAIMLSEAGLRNDDFLIDAVDISKQALKKSQRAIYGKHSFREKGMDFQNKYFYPVKAGLQLIPSIRDCVSFRQGNIIIDNISSLEEYYDIIFCRNLLIYFDRETQQKVLNKLSGMLRCGGLLFVGHAESGQVDKNDFTKVRVAKAFSFRKKHKRRSIIQSTKLSNHPVNKLKDIYDQLVEVTKKDIELSRKINNPKYKLIESDNKERDNNFRDKIDFLINNRHFSDAYRLCEQLLKKDRENSEAYYYLGVINALKGNNADAERYLRKAIYLSPGHREALELSAILAEKRGDDDSAKSLRRREKKARNRNS
ncbi:MAG: hypothetical protein L3J84_00315 [Gammaproteobacteria bacterium]|nr:hypothetical protein [Gammaproteobacteria bacterium]